MRRWFVVTVFFLAAAAAAWTQRQSLKRFAVQTTNTVLKAKRHAVRVVRTNFEDHPEIHQRAFYFWRTIWNPTAAELEILRSAHIQRLYIRLFDVEFKKNALHPTPVAPLRIMQALPTEVEFVPVIYLKNQVFTQISVADLPQFAEAVWNHLHFMAEKSGMTFTEWQLDCDWSDESRERFFRFADLLKQKSHSKNIALSATIRLHQIKYFKRTGIPPVDTGMLMFYNMGKLTADASRLSIFNSHDAELYTTSLKHYPLKLDVVLPVFSWVVHSRQGRITGLLEKTEPADLENNPGFNRRDERHFVAVQSFFFRGVYFKAGDTLTVEHIDPRLTIEAAHLVADSKSSQQIFKNVALFDLDERNFKQNKVEEYEKAFKYIQ